MKRIVLALVLLAFSCLTWAQSMQLQARLSSDQKPVVEGETNLPEGTKLGITLICPVNNCADFYMGQAGAGDQPDVVVHDGRFRTQPFDKDGSAIPSGRYVISTTITVDQSQDVIFKLLDMGWKRTEPASFHDTVDFGRAP